MRARGGAKCQIAWGLRRGPLLTPSWALIAAARHWSQWRKQSVPTTYITGVHTYIHPHIRDVGEYKYHPSPIMFPAVRSLPGTCKRMRVTGVVGGETHWLLSSDIPQYIVPHAACVCKYVLYCSLWRFRHTKNQPEQEGPCLGFPVLIVP